MNGERYFVMKRRNKFINYGGGSGIDEDAINKIKLDELLKDSFLEELENGYSFKTKLEKNMNDSKTNEKNFYKEESQTGSIKNDIYMGKPIIQTGGFQSTGIWASDEPYTTCTKLYSSLLKKLRNSYYDLMYDLMSFTFVNGKTVFKQYVYDIKSVSEINYDSDLNRYGFIVYCENDNIEISVEPDKKDDLEANRMEFIDWYKTIFVYDDMFKKDIYMEV